MRKIPARRRFSQNFLTDSFVLDSLIETIAPQQNESFLEIGPGRGALTKYFIQKTKQMHAVEIDRDLILLLKKEFPNLNLIEGDVLKIEFEKILKNPVRWVGNLPYHISSSFLLLLKKYKSLFLNGFFVLQKEVVERLIAQPHSKNYGRLSVVMQYDFHLEKCLDIPPESFNPPPKVFSSLIKITPKNEKNNHLTVEHYSIFEKLVQLAFQQRRKMLKNAWANWVTEKDAESCHIHLNQRAEELHYTDFVRLTQFLIQNKNEALF